MEITIHEEINSKIYSVRGTQVMLDRDLAKLYQVENRVLKQAVKRNIERFPSDFLFVLSNDEIDFLVSHGVIPSKKHLGELFSVESHSVIYHIKNIYKQKELQKNSTTRKIRVVQKEGSRKVEREVDHYNLDMIISR